MPNPEGRASRIRNDYGFAEVAYDGFHFHHTAAIYFGVSFAEYVVEIVAL